GETEEAEAVDDADVGIPLPATIGMLGISFLSCAVLIAGLPPLSGFVAKFAMVAGLFQPAGAGSASAVDASSWGFAVLLILSGLAALIATTRAGIRLLWDSDDRHVPAIKVIEMAPVAGLLLLSAALTVEAGPVMAYMIDTAQSLHAPTAYIQDVLSAPRVEA